MQGEPYEDSKDKLILRDYLAAERTSLANERTFLAYVRTAIGFAAAGATLLHFLESLATDVVGWALVAVSALVLIVGGWRYFRVRRYLERVTPTLRR